jgi:hypothetical protein
VWQAPKNWSEQAPKYLEALEKIPAWALAMAMRNCHSGLTFFPKPREIWDALPEQYHLLRIAKNRMEVALMKVTR